MNQVGGRVGEAGRLTARASVLESNGLAFDVPEVAQRLAEMIPHRRIVDDADTGSSRSLLRASDERPCSCRPAKKRYELPPPHPSGQDSSKSAFDAALLRTRHGAGPLAPFYTQFAVRRRRATLKQPEMTVS